ncbi:hypothetical protein O1W68_14230 [Rhodococcus sp. H36-A4]|uniref:hypothetical protein n=1 Tax=Rhodococcus sp. H36-A4 TaxID=3004353 RepID=UPI0022AED609|nr:hypothetical protein [Rhodococcus sp. H36-A4]MCZ4079104.1 hypothetical protein [Rhodococcus sp. H36-A4]
MPAQAWVTLLVGLVASSGVIVTWQQKNSADRRSEWWRRTTWAFERTYGNTDAEAQLGWRVLETLVASRLATRSDSDIVQVIAEQIALGDTDTSYEEEAEDDNSDTEEPNGPRHP